MLYLIKLKHFISELQEKFGFFRKQEHESYNDLSFRTMKLMKLRLWITTRKVAMDERFELPKIGDILVEEFLNPLEITPYRLAKDLGVSTSSILDLVHNKRKISVEMSLRLSKYFGTTSKFWLNMQNELDLREAQEKLGDDLDKIPSCKKTA